MSRDYNYQRIDGWKRGRPYDKYGHALSSVYWQDAAGDTTVDRLAAVKAVELTNPYGSLHFAVGSGDDFYCFDYAELGKGRVAVHVTINSETAHFIEDMHYGIHDEKTAAYELQGWVDDAITWAESNGVRHHKSGWNQDPWYVVRHYLAFVLNLPPWRDHTEKQLRFGKGPSDRGYLPLPFPCPRPRRRTERKL